jgi:ribulose-5-phosphate 4-epimerase/fuculose-1-phosphate aldolase
VLCTLKDPIIYPIDQNTARFYKRLSIDLGFSGIADNAAEGRRIAESFGNAEVLLMGNHGVSVVGATVFEAFETLYFLERAAKSLILAYATGRPLSIMPDDIAEKTALGWESYRGMGYAHFNHLKSRLDRDDPTYRD